MPRTKAGSTAAPTERPVLKNTGGLPVARDATHPRQPRGSAESRGDGDDHLAGHGQHHERQPRPATPKAR